jgi:NAD-dependent deacetylase
MSAIYARSEGALDAVAQHLRGSRRVLFVTGAGVSADSGLPTYRGVGGLYDNGATENGLPIETLLSGGTFRREPTLVWQYFADCENKWRLARLNACHRFIARLEHRLEKVLVLTQNIDGLHCRAGSSRVIDIHGNLNDLICTGCGTKRTVATYRGLELPPRCKRCRAIERPDVVLFGEQLPEEKLRHFLDELSSGFDMVISIGTTGTFPYIRAPMIRAKVYGWPTVDINPTSNQMTAYARYHVPLGAAEASELLLERLA